MDITTHYIERESPSGLLDEAGGGRARLPDFRRGRVRDDDRVRSLPAGISLGHPVGARGDASACGFEMTNADHEELAGALRDVRGRVVLSGYRTDLYDRLFEGWRRVDTPERLCHSVRKPRQEAAWINF